jgi:hypothetical protein
VQVSVDFGVSLVSILAKSAVILKIVQSLQDTGKVMRALTLHRRRGIGDPRELALTILPLGKSDPDSDRTGYDTRAVPMTVKAA